ncbi:nucleolar protein dao-5-like isoform X2 [Anneissia japonica]|uniref:nucleolar protein dao-5-like isoform X2 n=1 Tax=Anneissia japonica TaxID=1529436 RepID=UPI0014255414|nr:nucleolar protein dao-5-like isoform X2 [Anneissia japonica]
MLSQPIARPTCAMQSSFERDSYKLNYVEVEIGPPKQGRDDGHPVIRIQQTSHNVNYSTIVFPPKQPTSSLKSSEKESTNNNLPVHTNPTVTKPSQSKFPNVVSTNGPLSPPPAKIALSSSSSPPTSPLPLKSTPTKKSILAGILPSLPSKFGGGKFLKKNQAKNAAASNKDTSKNSKSSPKKTGAVTGGVTQGVSLPIEIACRKKNEENREPSSVERNESPPGNSKKILLASSPELSPQPRLRKRQTVERRARGRRQAVADTGSCSSSPSPAPSPEMVRKDLTKARPNTLELNDEDGGTVSENLQVSPGGSLPRRRALSTPTRGHQMLINETELADAIKSRKERYDSTGEELTHDDYSSSDDEPFMEIPQSVQAAQKAERERACQSLPTSASNDTKKITYEVVSLGAPITSGKGLTELAQAMKSMQNRVCRKSSVDGYEELERAPGTVPNDRTTADDKEQEGGAAKKIDRHEIEKIMHKSKLVKQLSISSESSAGSRLSDIQSILKDYDPSLRSMTPDIVCENAVKLKLCRVSSGNLRKHDMSKLQDGQKSPKNCTLDYKGQEVDSKGHRKPIPLPRSYLNRDSGHESSTDEKSGSSTNTSPSSTLHKARSHNVTPTINITMEKCHMMREKIQNTEVVFQPINGSDTYMNVMMKPRQQTRDRYYENVAIDQVLQNVSQRSDSPNPSPIPKRRVRNISGESSSSEMSLSPNQTKANLSQLIKQESSCRYSGGSDCGVRGRGDGQSSRPVPAPRYPKGHENETHNGKTWYFGKMPRQECENLLLSLAKPCQFLVRDSSHRAGDLMLSVLFGRKVHHYLIQTTQDEKFSIAHHDFNSVAEIIDFYTTHVIMYSSKNDPIYLGEPFVKHQ